MARRRHGGNGGRRATAVVAATATLLVAGTLAKHHGEAQRVEAGDAAVALSSWLNQKGLLVGFGEDDDCVTRQIPGKALSEADRRALGSGGDDRAPEDFDIAARGDGMRATAIGGRAGVEAVRLAVGGGPPTAEATVCALGNRSFTVDFAPGMPDSALLLVLPAKPA